MSDLTCYQRNRDVILNRERLREQARYKYRSMSEEKKQRLKEYQKNYREAKKSQYNNE